MLRTVHLANVRLADLASTLLERLYAPRERRDRGGHAVEYAIGIGLGAAAVLGVFAAYRAGLAKVVASWVFDMAGK
jgi:hypothetical protein